MRLFVFAAFVLLGVTAAERFKFIAKDWKQGKSDPPKKIVNEGTDVVIDCSTNDPGATIKLLYSTSKRFYSRVPESRLLRNGQELILKGVTLKDSGEYRCQAKKSWNIIELGKGRLSVVSAGKEEFKFIAKDWRESTTPPNAPIRKEVDPNKDLVIDCSTNDPDATVDLLYSPSSSRFASAMTTNKRIQKIGQKFTIALVGSSDNGKYVCQATGEGGNKIELKLGRLFVRKEGFKFTTKDWRPSLFSPPKKFVAIGTDFLIDCSTNDPNATVDLLYSKSKKSHPFVSFLTTKRVFKQIGQKFSLAGITRKDSGHYKCQANQGWKKIELYKGRLFVKKAVYPWSLEADRVCLGAKDNSFGEFKIQREGFLKALKLEYIDGYLTCDKSNEKNSRWGCATPPRVRKMVSIWVTDENNFVAFPKIPKPAVSEYDKYYELPGYDGNSDYIAFGDFSSPMFVREGQVVRIWYGDDMVNTSEYDNDGLLCVKVFANIS